MSAVVLSGLILAAMGMGLDPPTERPVIDQPEPVAQSVPRESAPAPTTGAHLTGVATWYRYVRGGAAAGPALRRWLGKGWRGTRVTVCADGCVRVTLSDWCLCSHGNRIIDLDVRAFDAIGSPSAGVMNVTVSR